MARKEKQIKFWDLNTVENLEKGIVNFPALASDNFATLSNVKDLCGLHFTEKHSGKMSGMVSLSTDCKINPHCIKNVSVPGSVCEKCFAQSQIKTFGGMSGMEKPLYINTLILNNAIIPAELLPRLNCLYFRFEAFGDLASETQVINYFNICEKNPETRFALWTKNPMYIDKAIKSGHEKPENLNIIFSSLFLNSPVLPPYKFIDKVFTVWTPDEIENHCVNINCGARSCINCLKCYRKNNIETINEKLK